MQHLKQKYFKRAMLICLSAADSSVKTFEDLKIYIEKEEIEIEERKIKIDLKIKNIETNKKNLVIARNNINYCKERLEDENLTTKEIRYYKEGITENEMHIGDAHSYISDAKVSIIELKEINEKNEIWLSRLYDVENLMKIERMKELNKGKAYNYNIL